MFSMFIKSLTKTVKDRLSKGLHLLAGCLLLLDAASGQPRLKRLSILAGGDSFCRYEATASPLRQDLGASLAPLIAAS